MERQAHLRLGLPPRHRREDVAAGEDVRTGKIKENGIRWEDVQQSVGLAVSIKGVTNYFEY